MPNQKVKNGLKAKKIKLPQMNFFWKTTNNIFMYLLAPVILQNLKKICPEQNFFGTNHYYYFHLPIGPFHCAKFKKILTMDPELWGCATFGPKMVQLPQKIFWKIINIIPIYLLAPFIRQNFKKVLPVDPELWGRAIFGPKMAHFPKWEFFQKTH